MQENMRSARSAKTKETDLQIGQQIKLARTLKEMSQSDLGLRLGISSVQISKYEAGQSTISIEKLKTICDILDVSIESVISKNQSLDKHPFFSTVIKDNSKHAKENEIYELVTRFAKIRNVQTRKTILDMIKLVRNDD